MTASTYLKILQTGVLIIQLTDSLTDFLNWIAHSFRKKNSAHTPVIRKLAVLTYIVNLFLNNPLKAENTLDLTELPIESLLNMEVFSASKFPQKKTDAPTTVTVITAQNIKDYGYRTLADILQSVRGVYVDNDRNYSYAGSRGFSIPGDLNTRYLVLLDGYRLNDAVYDQGPLGTEFPVDVDLIERVEYLPGAGSAIYGNNAFFGVINVITKSGKAFQGKGLEVSGRIASYGSDQERLSYGKQFDNGLEMLVSATRNDTQGENHLYFPEFDKTSAHNGMTSHPAFDNAERLFGKFSWQHFTLESGYSKRTKGLPIGTYGSEFNDPRNQNADQHIFVNLTYANQISEHLELYARAYHGRYDFPATYVYDNPPLTLSKEKSEGRWWGTEARVSSTHFDGHKLMLGGEFQDNFRLNDSWVDIDPPNSNTGMGFNRTNYRYGIYIQDEFTIRNDLILNAGLRYDYLSYSKDGINPRIALIYKPWEKAVFKLLYGTSFRAPNPNELYYSDPITVPSGQLNPEHIQTYESIIEYQPNCSWRLTAIGFHYEINDIIQTIELPNYDPDQVKFQLVNMGTNHAWGAEFEAEKTWETGARLRASYTWTHAYDASNQQSLINSPSNLFKLNFSTPLWNNRLRTGVEAQYTSSRLSVNQTSHAGFPLFNLTLSSGDRLFKDKLQGLEISGSIYNLFDEQYVNIASDQYVQSVIPQNGRNFRLVFTYRY